MPLRRTRSIHRKLALLPFDKLPAFLSDNEFIKEGYRVGWLASELGASVFQLHNETLNIWTHLLPLVYFLLSFWANYVEERKAASAPLCADAWTWTRWIGAGDACLASTPQPTWPMWVYRAGVVGCFTCSTVAHTFACHNPVASDTLWQFDYAGIAILITSSFFPPVFYGLSCAAPMLSTAYLVSIVALGVLTIVVTFAPFFSTKQMRPYRALVYVMLGSTGVVPLTHLASLHWGTGHRNPYWSDVLVGETCMALSYLTGAAFFATRVPERFVPGRFDLLGASHQVFHVFIALGTFAHIYSSDVFSAWANSGGTCM